MTIGELLEGAEVVDSTCDLSTKVRGLAYDSRAVRPGDLFFALRGERADGLGFAPQALEAGAAAVVCAADAEHPTFPHVAVKAPRAAMAIAADRFHGEPSRHLRVAGVTGTNGKTTTTHLIRHLCERAGMRCGMIGTITHWNGLEEVPAARTTPESTDIQGLLAEMLRSGCKACAMEVSSHALVQHRADAIRFAVAVFTNLTQDHLDYHGTMEEYFAAKSRLFEMLLEHGGRKARAVLNFDDRFGRRLAGRFDRKLKVLSYGMGVGAGLRASHARQSPRGTTFRLEAKGREYLVRSPLIGTFNVYNVLAALGAGLALGLELRAMVAALAEAPQVPGRLQRINAPRSFQVFVDYAHTPDALDNVLRALRELSPARLITVFGCGGDRDRAKRPLMAAAAEAHSDHVIVTSDNPRNEDPDAIIADIVEGLRRTHEVVPDREEAIRRAVEAAEPGDIILIAGKGHENYQEVRGTRLDFDDAKVAARAIAEKPVQT